jgi:hypothetical protein
MLFELTQKLLDLAEAEQNKAFGAFVESEGNQGPKKAVLLGDRDMHKYRAEAFLEAAQIAKEALDASR